MKTAKLNFKMTDITDFYAAALPSCPRLATSRWTLEWVLNDRVFDETRSIETN